MCYTCSSVFCMFCTDIIWLHIHVTNFSIVLTLVSCCLWWRPPVSGTVPPASSSAGTLHRVPVSEDEEGHTVYPATEIDSLQQYHSDKQAAGIPKTTWHVQQQHGVADYTCSPLSVPFIAAGVSHAPRQPWRHPLYFVFNNCGANGNDFDFAYHRFT